jgi:hypothetical protein
MDAGRVRAGYEITQRGAVAVTSLQRQLTAIHGGDDNSATHRVELLHSKTSSASASRLAGVVGDHRHWLAS